MKIKSQNDFAPKTGKINHATVMDKSIHTPVKRQYINALFEMAVNQRRRVATILNFLSFFNRVYQYEVVFSERLKMMEI